MKHRLAKALFDRCPLLGDRGYTEGLKLEWVEVESIIHDVAHMVTLGLRVTPSDEDFDLGLVVNDACTALGAARAKENERMTLATQLIFLNRMDAFVDGCHARWALGIAGSVEMTVDSIYRRVLDSDASLLAHRLYKRLVYHSRPR